MTRQQVQHVLAVAALWLGVSGLARISAADEMYRWTDAQGGIHFGSAPPSGAQGVKRIDSESAGTAVVVGPPGLAAPPSQPQSPPAPGPGSVDGSEASAPATPPSRASAAEDDEDSPAHRIGGRTQTQWRQGATRRRESVERARLALERAEEEEREAFAHTARGTDYDRLERLKKKVESAENELESFEDEARAAEVPQNWLD